MCVVCVSVCVCTSICFSGTFGCGNCNWFLLLLGQLDSLPLVVAAVLVAVVAALVVAVGAAVRCCHEVLLAALTFRDKSFN